MHFPLNFLIQSWIKKIKRDISNNLLHSFFLPFSNFDQGLATKQGKKNDISGIQKIR